MPTKSIDGNLPDDVPITVGIDQSLTGFALCALSLDDLTKHHTWVYKSPYMGVERLADIRQWLTDTFNYLSEKHHIEDVAMEETVLASYSALKMGELASVVKLTIYDFFDDERRFPMRVPPMTLKKFASGKGNAKKQEMLLQIFKRWGIEFNDDNAADAYALARLTSKTYVNEMEAEIAKKMSDPKYRDEPHL